MKLSQLLEGNVVVSAEVDQDITDITLDSRKALPGSLFVALKGCRQDGCDFIKQAINNGAVAVLTDSEPACEASIPVLVIPELRKCLGNIARRLYPWSAERLSVTGVTGTNGKTSCTHFIAQAFHLLEKKSAVIGTLGIGLWEKLQPSEHTTPDVIQLHQTLSAFAHRDVEYVAMEVSSHALAQDRVNGIDFETAVFTNLTHDHLDYHGDMSRYGAEKAKLFQQPHLKNAVINLDDPFSAELLKQLDASVKVLTYSVGNEEADICAVDLEATAEGSRFCIQTKSGSAIVETPLLGHFNVGNLLATIAVLQVSGVECADISNLLPQLCGVRGRMQPVRLPNQVSAVIDYAHTPDALKQALMALRPHCQGQLWCVFGCGGERDRSKRPLMGTIAKNYADHVVVTSDNPRRESPDQIIKEICNGTSATLVEPDRGEAIRYALGHSQPGDVVLIAGKGHETYQDIDGHHIAYNDENVVQQFMQGS